MRFVLAACAFVFGLSVSPVAAQSLVAGTTSGQFEVSPIGSPQYSLPLTIPPGTAGMEPKLALSYDSSITNGPMGVGWTISGLSSITRCPATLDQDQTVGGLGLNYDDRFCLDGQRLVSLGGFNGGNGTEYRTRSESFSKVQSFGNVQGYPTHWIVESKAGVTYEYGVTTNSRHQSGSDILSWNLNKAIDKNGNYFAVSYYQDTNLGELILARIDYTGNEVAGILPNNSVVIGLDAYPGSADSSAYYVGGKRFVSNKDISRIEIFTGNTLVRSYWPQYEYSQILNNNRLKEFKECDASGACLPATKFTWGSDDPAAHTFEPPYNYSFSASNYPDSNLAPVVTGDWNGDGKTDLARVNYYGSHIFLATATGLVKQPDLADFGYSSSGYSNSYDYPLFSGDFNGDGCTDIGRGASSGTQVHLSNCSGGFIGGFSHLYGFSPKSNSLIVGDWNGDGKSDIAGHISGTTIRLYLSTGSSFSFMNDYAVHANVAPSDSLQTGDFNGDGLTDFSVHHPSSGTYYYVSTGSHFNVCFRGNQWPNSAACFSTAFNGGAGALVHGDWNGDGITDSGKILSNGFNACVLDGNSAIAHCKLIPAFGLNTDSNITARPLFVGDFNGDGLTDVARVQNNGVRIFYARSYHDGTVEFQETTALSNFGASQGFSNEDVAPIVLGDWNGDGHLDFGRSTTMGHFMANHRAHKAQRITKIEEGLGKTYEINYGTLTDSTIYTKGSGLTYPNVDLQSALPVVASYSVSDGLGGQATYSYRYTGLSYNIFKRSINAFQKIEIHNQNSGLTDTTWYLQANPYEGMPYKKEVALLSGTVVSRTEDDWDTLSWNQSGQWRYFPYVRESREFTYEINGSLISSSVTQNTFDAFGNMLTRNLTRSDGSVEATVSTYDNDVTNWLIGQLRSSTVTKSKTGASAPAAVTKRVAFNYSPGTGLLQSEVVEPGHPLLELTKSYQYDSFGNITQKTVSGAGIQPRTETTVYDNRGQFAVSSTNPLGQTETKVTDPKYGKITSLTGPNGITTTWQYDSFGRVVLEHRADGSETATQYEFPGATAPANAALGVRVSTTGLPAVVTYADELGRQIRKETTGFSGQKIFEDKVYDTKGNLTHVSDPYFEGSTPVWSVSEYDDLGRATRVTQPGNRVTQTIYNGLSTTVINPLNQSATQTVDAQGFVLTSTDAEGQTLSFKNDNYGNPIEIMDPLLNTTFIEYDLQGKRTKLIDPDTGTSTYTYNALGELLTETNALNQTTTYSYDLLGRMLQRSSADGVESWQYDTALNGIGKLARVTGLRGYLESYEYDSLGRLYRTSTTVGGKTFVSSQTYDALSRVDTYSYPSAFTIKNIYNSHGYLSEIKRTDLNSSVWKINQLNAKGQLEQQSFGNGLVSNKIYDTNTGYLTAVQTSGVQNLSFSFDALGNLLERQDLGAGLRENFSYDTLNRLKTATILGRAPVTVQYDEIGNLISRSDIGTYSYGVGAGPHAVTSITGHKANTYLYDAAGNRISSSDGNISYSSTGKPVSITKGTKRVEFDLNPADQRVEERVYSNNSLTERKTYVGGLYESSVKGLNTINTHYIKGSDGLVAIVTSGSSPVTSLTSSAAGAVGVNLRRDLRIRYLHLDHLGSIQAISDAAGRVVEVLSYDAWGQRRDAVTWDSVATVSSVTDRGFTGHEHLDEVSLVHMNGRVYDPVIGRFVSADPFVQAPWNIQSYNRYSYVLNNPLSLTDPTGYFSFKKAWKKALNISKSLIKTAIVTAAGSIGNSIGGPIGASFLSTFTSTLLHGGSISQAFQLGVKGIPKGVLRSYIDFKVGDFTAGMDMYTNALAHAVADGAYASATGGDFASGFAQGGFGAFGANYGGSYGTFVAALSGGTGAALTGGKFEEGAMRGAFIYLYNHEAHKQQNANKDSKSGQEALKLSFGALMSEGFDRTASLVGPAWKAPVISGLSSYGLSTFGIAQAVIAAGKDPASMRAQLELTMSIFGTLPVVNRLSIGYDMGKAAAYTIDAFGGFDWWVAHRDNLGSPNLTGWGATNWKTGMH